MVSKEVLTAAFLLCLVSGLGWTGSLDCESRGDGFYADPTDCNKYYRCVGSRVFAFKCPKGLEFNEELHVCDWKKNALCRNVHPPSTNTATTSPTTKTMQQTASPRKMDSTPITQTTASTTEASPGEMDSTPIPQTTASITEASPGEMDSTPIPQTTASITGCSRRVCYYTNWSQYRPGNGRFVPTDVDPFLCTHLVYAFAKLNGNHLEAFEWNDESTDWSKGMYEQFNDLKKINPNLKTLLAVGGWNLASAPFTKMVATAESRQDFADHSVTFLKSNGFDGLDLDWEYPANRGSPPGDKEKFTLLIRQLRETYDKYAAKNGGSPLLLTAAVAAGKSTIDTAYDIPQISQHLDYISLMSYDFHGSWETVTGHHSGLYAHSSESEPQSFLNTDWAARHWVSKGCPKDKLVIGIATYARTFTLRSSSDSSLGAHVTGGGAAGTYTREKGFLAYYEVCNMVTTANVHRWIKDQKVPYLVKGNQWVGYENVDSVTIKARYAISNGYGGVMTWSLDLDDFSGKFCGHGKYPLWGAVNAECKK